MKTHILILAAASSIFALTGGLMGAAAGGVIGHQSGRGLEGAAIGGAIGAGAGAIRGNARY
jgi:uncharacterized protein YcfJ